MDGPSRWWNKFDSVHSLRHNTTTPCTDRENWHNTITLCMLTHHVQRDKNRINLQVWNSVCAFLPYYRDVLTVA